MFQNYPMAAKLFVRSLLKRDIALRLGADLNYDTVMEHPFFAEVEWAKLEAKGVEPPWVPA